MMNQKFQIVNHLTQVIFSTKKNKNMNQTLHSFITQKSLECKEDSKLLYDKGMEYLLQNIEYYFDKPYSCDTVLKELFERGINNFIKQNKTQP